MTDPAHQLSFQHSRIYAQGWNAARRMALAAGADLEAAAAANPYQTEPERTRWNEGFAGAMA